MVFGEKKSCQTWLTFQFKKPMNTISAHIPEKINSAKCPAETCNNKVAIEAQKCLTVYIPQSLMFGS